ncbi:MAG: NAD-dependent malic enzyme, partial [Actinomycetota bacterium]|nr:NAD-dependent malic enzyme [Actinomycetota bacterium]
VSDDELDPEYITPSVFNRDVASAVATSVAEAAQASGVARRPRRPASG